MSTNQQNTKNNKLNIEKLITRVLQDNKNLLSDTNLKTKELLKDILMKYSFKFFTLVKKKSPKITYGLQLGITKHFCDFSIKSYAELGLILKKEELNSYYETITMPAANMVACLDNSGLAVYAIIKELKLCINNSYLS